MSKLEPLRIRQSAVVYYGMQFCWAMDDLHWAFKPFCWLGDWLEDWGLDHGYIKLSDETVEDLQRAWGDHETMTMEQLEKELGVYEGE